MSLSYHIPAFKFLDSMVDKSPFAFHDIELFKSECLGSGSYGGVCKAKCDGLPCAAKIMHPTLFDRQDPGTSSYISKFQEECRLLSLARHPNVVQYLATYYDLDTQLPVLLMEICDESLTAFLERSPGPLSYHIQINICQDIAQALVYLHSNGLIHRDLTGNNVLMIAGTRAKITDFGMSRLATVNPRMTALTICPGNVLYMSPEALDEAKSYTAKLDIFSFGVIVIQILTRKFPNPSDRFRALHDSSTEEEVRVVVPENERRKDHLEMIPETHPLKPHSLKCLRKENERPLAQQLTKMLSELKESSQFKESMSQTEMLELKVQSQMILADSLTNEAQEYQRQNADLLHMVQEKDRQLQEVQSSIRTTEKLIEEERRALSDATEIKKITESELQQVQQLLEAREQIQDSDIQPNLNDATKTDLQKTPAGSGGKAYQKDMDTPQQEENTVPQMSGVTVTRNSISEKTWREGKSAPEKMARGAAAVHGDTVYIRPANSSKIYSYQDILGEEQWSLLPGAPNGHCSLAIVDSLLTCVCGFNNGYTNTLLSLKEVSGGMGRWCELFPPMPTPRRSTVCVTTSQALVVAGGYADSRYLDTVEVMKISSKQWTRVCSLPKRLSHCSAAVCGDTLYLAGGLVDEDSVFSSSKSVFIGSILDLMQQGTLKFKLKRTLSQTRSAWKEVCSLPVIHSTLALFSGRILAVGGRDDSGNPTDNVYSYDTESDSWKVVSQMKNKVSLSLAVSLPQDCLVVIGGYTQGVNTTNSVTLLK